MSEGDNKQAVKFLHFVHDTLRVRAFFAEIKETKSNHVILQVELLFTCSDKFAWTVMQLPSFGGH